MRRLYRNARGKKAAGEAAIFSPFFILTAPEPRQAARLFAAFNDGNNQGVVMEKTNHFAAEIVAQVALALAVGVFVSVVLAGATMLLATA